MLKPPNVALQQVQCVLDVACSSNYMFHIFSHLIQDEGYCCCFNIDILIDCF